LGVGGPLGGPGVRLGWTGACAHKRCVFGEAETSGCQFSPLVCESLSIRVGGRVEPLLRWDMVVFTPCLDGRHVGSVSLHPFILPFYADSFACFAPQ
jgi:hypothetical protein